MENTYLESDLYISTLNQQLGSQQLNHENIKLGEIERKPGQCNYSIIYVATQEDKSRKFEKVKTAIIAELELDYIQEKKRYLEIE